MKTQKSHGKPKQNTESDEGSGRIGFRLDPETRERLAHLSKVWTPEISISGIIRVCLEGHLPVLEKRYGIGAERSLLDKLSEIQSLMDQNRVIPPQDPPPPPSKRKK